MKAKSKIILAGDPLQLPPTIKSIKPKTSSKKTPTTKNKNPAVQKIKGKTSNAQSRSSDTKPTPIEEEEQTETLPADSCAAGSQEDIADGKSPTDGSCSDEHDTKPGSHHTTEPRDVSNAVRVAPAKTTSGPKVFNMRPAKTLETTMFDRILAGDSSASCLLDVQYVSISKF